MAKISIDVQKASVNDGVGLTYHCLRIKEEDKSDVIGLQFDGRNVFDFLLDRMNECRERNGEKPMTMGEMMTELARGYKTGNGYEEAKIFSAFVVQLGEAEGDLQEKFRKNPELAEEYARAVVDYFKELLGEKNIYYAVLHTPDKDEQAYHVHILATPMLQYERRSEYVLDENGEKVLTKGGKPKRKQTTVRGSGRWNISHNVMFNNGKDYEKLHDKLAEHLQGLGYTELERGERNTGRKHITTREYQEIMQYCASNLDEVREISKRVKVVDVNGDKYVQLTRKDYARLHLMAKAGALAKLETSMYKKNNKDNERRIKDNLSLRKENEKLKETAELVEMMKKYAEPELNKAIEVATNKALTEELKRTAKPKITRQERAKPQKQEKYRER